MKNKFSFLYLFALLAAITSCSDQSKAVQGGEDAILFLLSGREDGTAIGVKKDGIVKKVENGIFEGFNANGNLDVRYVIEKKDDCKFSFKSMAITDGKEDISSDVEISLDNLIGVENYKKDFYQSGNNNVWFYKWDVTFSGQCGANVLYWGGEGAGAGERKCRPVLSAISFDDVSQRLESAVKFIKTDICKGKSF